jgi:uncharacterized protein
MSTSVIPVASLYDCTIVHRRRAEPRIRFTYRLPYLLVDIDHLDELHQRLRLFSRNAFNLISVHDQDHGARQRGAMRAWAVKTLRRAGVELANGHIRLLCLPRVFGYAFNPISLWYCDGADGQLRAVIAEVRNTFGERHSYVLKARDGVIAWDQPIVKDKAFHVSPFLELKGTYAFRLEAPAQQVRLHIREHDGTRDVLEAHLVGQHRALTDRSLLASVARMPWVALKVVVAIHWQALLLWLRGARVYTKPNPPSVEVS